MINIPPSLFADLAPEHADSLRQQGTARSYPANTVLIQEGDESSSLYLIEEGECKVVSTEDGRDVLLGFIGPGEFFGELAMLDGEPRSSTVITTAPSRVRTISAAHFRDLIARHPETALALLQALARKIRVLTENVRSLAVKDVYGRVVRVLMALSAEREDGTRLVSRRLTHQEIADMVGASREMVSRTLRELSVGDYIEVVKRHILIKRKLPERW